jgi:hypothetical protein
MTNRTRWATYVATVQGLYYGLSGIWPLINMNSFEAVTGDKLDEWLVRVVSALIIVIAAVLLTSAARRRVVLETWILATGSAAALAIIDIYYVAVGRISFIYLGDAALQIVLIAGWILAWRQR